MSLVKTLIDAALSLSAEVKALQFAEPTAYIYNPLEYAWEIHKHYLELAGQGQKKVVFLGMNPGPFGMAQTGVPFGEIPAVKDWMGYGVTSPSLNSNILSAPWMDCLAPRAKLVVEGYGVCLPSAIQWQKTFLRIILWLIIVRLFLWKQVGAIVRLTNYPPMNEQNWKRSATVIFKKWCKF